MACLNVHILLLRRPAGSYCWRSWNSMSPPATSRREAVCAREAQVAHRRLAGVCLAPLAVPWDSLGRSRHCQTAQGLMLNGRAPGKTAAGSTIADAALLRPVSYSSFVAAASCVLARRLILCQRVPIHWHLA